jgi:catechol 2,3-dioxygenase-like lactoylglutathione lyase family enzyme
MSFRVLGTNHTGFTVSNLDRTLGFFRDCLGFELISKAPRDPALVSRITGVEGDDSNVCIEVPTK